MKGAEQRHNFILHSTVFLIACLGILVVAIYALHMQRVSEADPLDGPFTVTDDGKKTENVSLSSYVIGHMVERGEQFVIEGTLPENLPDPSTLSVLTYLSAVEVTAGGENCYSYGEDLFEEGKIIGSGYHFADLPDDAGGMPFTVTITAGERNAFTSLSPLQVAGADEIYPAFVGRNFYNLLIAVFMILLGFISAGGSLVAVFWKKRYRRLIYIGMFVLLLGIWILCNEKTMQIFSSNLRYSTILEYVSLYTAEIPFFCLIRFMRQDAEKWKKIAMDIVVAYAMVFAMVTSILQSTGVFHISNCLRFFHIGSAACLIIMIFTALKPINEMSSSERLMNIAILIMCLFAGGDLVRFNVMKYIAMNEAALYNSIIPFGSLIFTVLLFMSFFYSMYELVTRQARADSLEKAAYREPVTGLYNRTYSEKRFRELSAGNSEYLIINMDLNGLKKTNDTYGHAVGDKLITRFADSLREGFSGVGEPFRMGGDEYMVIVENPDMEEVRAAFKKLFECTVRYSFGLPTKIAFAYGIASSQQFSGTNEEYAGQKAEFVYAYADRKMYEMKGKKRGGAAVVTTGTGRAAGMREHIPATERFRRETKKE